MPLETFEPDLFYEFASSKIIQQYKNRKDTIKNGQLIVAIAGIPGSGKSTAVAKIQEKILETDINCSSLPMDGFHFYKHELDLFPSPDEAHKRRGSPETFNSLLLLEKINKLRNEGSCSFPSFEHSTGDPVDNDISINLNSKIIIIEGNYLLLNFGNWEKLRPNFDMSFFLHCDTEKSMKRVCSRHQRTMKISEIEAQEKIDCNDRLNAMLTENNSSLSDHEVYLDY